VIAGLVDPRPEAIAALRARFPALGDVPAFETMTALYTSVTLDGVVLLTPHAQHAGQILDALARGLHVLVEKPMVTQPEDGAAVVAAAAASGRVVVVSYQRHYQPQYVYIKRAIESGAIGRLRAVAAVQGQNWRTLTTGKWRQDASVSGGGMMMDTGSHLVDVVTWLIDQPVRWVAAAFDNDGAPVDINSHLTVGFEGNVQASLSMIGDMPYVGGHVFEDVTISGTAGALLYRNGRVFTLGPDGFTEPVILPPSYNADRNWLDAIQGLAPNDSPPLVGLRVAQLSAAARLAAQEGRRLEIGD
jgi:predicted dehydrogenase